LRGCNKNPNPTYAFFLFAAKPEEVFVLSYYSYRASQDSRSCEISSILIMAMADLGLQGRKTFKVFNQDFIVDERYVVTKELGQGAYGIVWYV
jgi:hypothetical protein